MPPANFPPADPLAGEDAELGSTQRVLRLLDKTSRAARTYGLDNAATTRFFEQLQSEMGAHLEKWSVLGVVVERGDLLVRDQLVFQSEEGAGEGLVFRLYGDGIRELRFHQGAGPEDLRAFLEALWGSDKDSDADDDIVTRLWAKDLPTISFVTAEDIMQAPVTSELSPQESGFFAPPPASFDGVLERERRALGAGGAGRGAGVANAGENLGPGGMIGFEVTDAEREALLADMNEERGLDGMRYVLEMLGAILASEKAPDLIARALALLPDAFDVLLRAGSWTALVELLQLIDRVPDENDNFEPSHRMLAARVADSLNIPQRVALIEEGLQAEPAQLAAVRTLLLRLKPATVAPLCGVLARAASDEHRAALCEALLRLGAENPEPILQGLSDPRPRYVRDLIGIAVVLARPRTADALALLARNPDPEVRRDALTAIARLRPRGDGAALVAFASDADRQVRLQALRLLVGGQYTATWEAWRRHAESESLLELPAVDKRALFHAMRATSGDAAVPYFRDLLSEKGWRQRKQREETALVAIDVLVMLGSPKAADALELGKQSGNSAVRQACAAALAGLARRGSGKGS